MTDFTIHTVETAPEASKPILTKIKSKYGRIPALYAVMAESPSLIEAYMTLNGLFTASSLNKDECTVVWQTINIENNCGYCTAGHTGIAKAMGVSDEISNALRNNTPLPSAKLEALRKFTLSLVRDRGHLDDAKVKEFLAAGYTKQNILDVILGYSQKIISNYTNHFANTPLDKEFQQFEWHKKSA